MMVSQTALLRASLLSDDNLGPYLVGSMLTADNQGNIFRIDMEDDEGKPLPKSDWGIKTIATLRSVDDIASGNPKSYSMPHGVVLANHKGYTWLAGGTADIQVLKEATEDYEDGYIRNDKQMIFAFRTGKGQSAPYTRDKFKATGDDPDSSYQAAADTAYEGWHLPLREGDATHFREYVSTKSVLIGGTLFVATFIRKDKQDANDSSVCSTTRLYDGDSRLFAIDVTTSLGNTWDAGDDGKTPKYIEFKGVKIVSLTTMEAGGRDKMLIDFDILNEADNNIMQLIAKQTKLHNVFSAETNEPLSDKGVVDTPPVGGAIGKFPPGIRLLNYWIKE
jgi:hypothetical protein